MDSKGEEQLSKDEGHVQDLCARKVMGNDKAETRVVMDLFFQACNLR